MTAHAGHVLARRAARIAFGVVLIAGASYLLVRLAAITGTERSLHAARVFGVTWCAAITAQLATYLLVRRAALPGTDATLRTASLVVPAIGVALVMPLTLHLLFMVATGNLVGFDDWVLLSLVITGPAHIAFAILAAARAYQLMRGDELMRGDTALSPVRILALTTLVSCVPFVLYFGIPPALVFVTGIPIVPMLGYMAVIADRERKVPDRSVPRAIVWVR